MNCVVIYYSFTGNNRQLALELQRRLGCDGVEVSEARPRSRMTILLDVLFGRKPSIRWTPCELAKYDKALLVAPVWAGHIAAPLAAFVAGHKAQLPPFAFLSLCSGVPGQPARIHDELRELTGRAPDAVEQLNVNELLPPEHRNKARYTSAYRLGAGEVRAFDAAIDSFLHALPPAAAVSETPLPAGLRASAPSGSRSPGTTS
jgi:hypothetical protein